MIKCFSSCKRWPYKWMRELCGWSHIVAGTARRWRRIKGGDYFAYIKHFFGYSLRTFLSICNLKWAKIRHMPTPACKIHLSETPFFACKGLGLDPLCLWLLASWRAPLVTLLHPVYRTLLWVAKMFSRTLLILVLGEILPKTFRQNSTSSRVQLALAPVDIKNLKGSK